MFILSFSISFVCLVVILLIFCVIPLWDSGTAHSPSGKELNPSFQEDTRFSGRCTSVYNFNFILRHSSLGLSHSSLKKFKLSSMEEWYFSGIIVLLMFSHYTAWDLYGLVITHVAYWTHVCIYTIRGLFQLRKTAAIQNVLFYVWSISTAKDRHFAEKCSPRLWWSEPNKVTFTFFWQNIRKRYYGLPQESLWLHNFYSNNIKF